MAWWEWLVDVAGVALALLLVYAVALMARRRIISRDGGIFELSHRVVRGRESAPGRGWLLGLGRYSREELEWFRIFSLSPAPKRTWRRTALSYVSSRHPEGLETVALYPDHLIVVCRSGDQLLELAMSSQSLIGFQAWLEAHNPGTDWSRASL
jgi:hypothetical protein